MHLLLALLTLCVPFSAPAAVCPTGAGTLAQPRSADALSGTWDGLYEPPGSVGGQPFALLLELLPDGEVRGQIAVRQGTFELIGRFTAASSTAELSSKDPAVLPLALELTLAGDRMQGWTLYGGARLPLTAERVSAERLARDLQPPLLVLDRERPATFSQVGLSDEQGFAIDDLLAAFAEQNSVVGLSMAVVLDGRLADVRSLGWQDLVADVPTSGETQYRWASISKSLTAVTAVLLADSDDFDLEADVRGWVPEYPEQPAVITPLAILGHLSGITHYSGAQRTWRTYEVPYPFEDRILALDIFKETPLLAAPGEHYSYSTHAYSLLGAALQRAAGKPYEQLVAELVLQPLGMTHTAPDFRSNVIARRTHGYQVVEGGVQDSGEDDVSWKLPGGGWTSTVGDLGRFAAGLTGDGLLSADQKQLLWTEGATRAGEPTGYGLGFSLGELDGRRTVAHGGAQLKTATYMLVLPDDGRAVVLMSNTEGVRFESLAASVMRTLLR